MPQIDTEAAEELFDPDSQSFTHLIGGLEFYGCSQEFRNLVGLCRDMATCGQGEIPAGSKAYVFLPPFHGKSSLANALQFEATANGLQAFRFDGTAGATVNELRQRQGERGTLMIVDGVPESPVPRKKLLERFNSLSGAAILLADPVYASDSSLNQDTPTLSLPHVNQRYKDKVAWILGLVAESLRDEAGDVQRDYADALRTLAKGKFRKLCDSSLRDRVSEIRNLTGSIAQAIRLAVTLSAASTVSDGEIGSIFVNFYASTSSKSTEGFRLWVEGESDLRLLDLVARLALPVHHFDLRQGLTVVPLGLGRDGGTGKAIDIVVKRATKRNHDVFLLDCDEPGRHAKQKFETLDQEVMILDACLACGQMGEPVEIEDLISVGCLDRFYVASRDLRPETELIRYKPPVSRRLVVNGIDKELLVDWLDQNARLEDLENLMFVLCEARERFSLKNPQSVADLKDWKRRLTEEVGLEKRQGQRPDHWSI